MHTILFKTIFSSKYCHQRDGDFKLIMTASRQFVKVFRANILIHGLTVQCIGEMLQRNPLLL